MKQLQASEICGAGDRISLLLERLQSFQAQSSSLQDEMRRALEGGARLLDRRERRTLCDQRVRRLRREAERRRLDVEGRRARMEESRRRLAGQAERLLTARQQLAEAKEAQQEAAGAVAAAYAQVRTLWRQLRCRQIRMLHEACQVYPIENCGRYWTIRRLCIASIEKLSRQDLREEENVSTALGFLAHLFVTFASFLEVPLRITIHRAGCSRSLVSDPHGAAEPGVGPRELPLYYGRGIEKQRFEMALLLFKDGLHQFLYSRGYFKELRLNSGNLLECMELILRREMYGLQQA